MDRWVRVNDNADGGRRYFNLRFAKRLTVLPTIADPSKFTITIDTEASNLDDTLETGLWDTAAEANEALRMLVQGFDVSNRVV